MKSKFVAVLLAVIFGFWTWLYTYKRDYQKFWICFVPGLILIALVFFFPDLLLLEELIAVGVWIWAVLDTLLKKQEWYRDY